jgi:hypothetical protein
MMACGTAAKEPPGAKLDTNGLRRSSEGTPYFSPRLAQLQAVFGGEDHET